jgi:hypothetical protein
MLEDMHGVLSIIEFGYTLNIWVEKRKRKKEKLNHLECLVLVIAILFLLLLMELFFSSWKKGRWRGG